jgi:hypothetical protein
MRESFEAWMSKVDGKLLAMSGLTHHDLADQTWRDWYDDEMPPREAAELCLEDEGYPI